MQRTASDSDSVEEFETASETDSSDDAVRGESLIARVALDDD